MNDYIMRLAAKSLGLLEVVSPRLASLYEPLSSDIWDTIDTKWPEVLAQERIPDATLEHSNSALKNLGDPGESILGEEVMREKDCARTDLSPSHPLVEKTSSRDLILKEEVIMRPALPSYRVNAHNAWQNKGIIRVLKKRSADKSVPAKSKMMNAQSGMPYSDRSVLGKVENVDPKRDNKVVSAISSSSTPALLDLRSSTNFKKKNKPIEQDVRTFSKERQSKRSIGHTSSSEGQISDYRAMEANEEIASESAWETPTKDVSPEIKMQFVPLTNIFHQSENISGSTSIIRGGKNQRSEISLESPGSKNMERDCIVNDIVSLEDCADSIKTEFIEQGITGDEQEIHSKTASPTQGGPNLAGKTLPSSFHLIKPLRNSNIAEIGNDVDDRDSSWKERLTSQDRADSRRNSNNPVIADSENLVGLNKDISSKRSKDIEDYSELVSASPVSRNLAVKTSYVSSPLKQLGDAQTAHRGMERENNAGLQMPQYTHLSRSSLMEKPHPGLMESDDLKSVYPESEYLDETKSDKKQRLSKPSLPVSKPPVSKPPVSMPPVSMSSIELRNKERTDTPEKEPRTEISLNQTYRPPGAEPFSMHSSQISMQPDETHEGQRWIKSEDLKEKTHHLSYAKMDLIIDNSEEIKSDKTQRLSGPSLLASMPSVSMPSMDLRNKAKTDKPEKEPRLETSLNQTYRPPGAKPFSMHSIQMSSQSYETGEAKKIMNGQADLMTDQLSPSVFRPSIRRVPVESRPLQTWPSGGESGVEHHQNESQISDRSPSVRVTIGRVSVHASQVVQPARENPPSFSSQKISLNDYLKMRNEGRI